MNVKRARHLAVACGLIFALAAGARPARAQSEVPAGTRFLVELNKELDAKKVKRGKKFEARTVEALRATDGSVIEAGAKVKGQVTYADNNSLVLSFERIEARGKKLPLAVTVLGVPGEKGVKHKASEEGEIKSSGSRGKGAAIGAAIGAGAGAAVGASQGGGKGAAIGAATGAAGGAIIGAAAGGHDLVLRKGARIELELDRPLLFKRK